MFARHLANTGFSDNEVTDILHMLMHGFWTPAGAQLSARGETRSYASLDELASQLSEHALPVEALFGWLNGRTQAIARWDVQLEPGQRLMARRTEPLPTAELRLIWAPTERKAP
jgi:hypothetical protein